MRYLAVLLILNVNWAPPALKCDTLFDKALRANAAAGSREYYGCDGEPVSEQEYQNMLDHWALWDEVYAAIFDGAPPAGCGDHILLYYEPTVETIAVDPGNPLDQGPQPAPLSTTVMGTADEASTPDAWAPTGHAEVYEITRQEVIPGLRVDPATNGHALELEVVTYVRHTETLVREAWGGELPGGWAELTEQVGFATGTLWGRLQGPAGQVPVVGILVAIDMPPYDPEADMACCLPDGTCSILPQAECVVQGGIVPPGGLCRGDHDGDGIDDALQVEFDPDRLVMFFPLGVLSEEELAVMYDYEEVSYCLTYGTCAGDDIFVPGELARRDAAPPGGGHSPGVCSDPGNRASPEGVTTDDVSPSSKDTAFATSGRETSIEECMANYRDCMKNARRAFRDAMHAAVFDLANCQIIAYESYLVALGVCLFTSGFTPAALGCCAAVSLSYLAAITYCFQSYAWDCFKAKHLFTLHKRDCYDDALACGYSPPIPVVP